MSSDESMETKIPQTFKEQFLDNLLDEKPSTQLKVWHNGGVLKEYMPDLEKCGSTLQDPYFHPDNVFEHLIHTCDNIDAKPSWRWAALLHDIGKAVTRKQTIYCQKDLPEKQSYKTCPYYDKRCDADCLNASPKITFYNHASLGVNIAKRILKSFGIGSKQAKFILWLISEHMYHFVPEWTNAAIQRFIQRTSITKEDVKNASNYSLFCLRAADRMSRDLDRCSIRQTSFEKRLLEYFEKEAHEDETFQNQHR